MTENTHTASWTRTVDRWDPQVGGPSIHDHTESLARGANGDLTIVRKLEDEKNRSYPVFSQPVNPENHV